MCMGNYSANAVGLRIKALMSLHGYTQTDLSLVLGTSQAAVSRKLRTEVPMKIGELIDIANWLGVSVAELFEPLPEQFELVEAVA